MPSRFNIPGDPPPLPGPGVSGEVYEHRLSNPPPNLYLPSYFNKDGGDMRVFESELHGQSKSMMVDVKKRNDGPANGAWSRKIEDYMGERTGDNGVAVWEGERARKIEEMGEGTLPDHIAKIMHEAFVTRSPISFFYRTVHGDYEGLWADYDWGSEWVVMTKFKGPYPDQMEPVQTEQVPVSVARGASRGHIRPDQNVVMDD